MAENFSSFLQKIKKICISKNLLFGQKTPSQKTKENNRNL